jgi:hypothetical protein
MDYQELTLLVARISLLCNISSLRADETSWPDTDRIALGYRVGFNISAKFQNLGSTPLANNPSVAGLSYQDGFVGTDNIGNAGGLTSFWGYQNAHQVVDNNSYLLMRSSNPGALGSSVDNGPYQGLELSYNHELARFKKVRWGIEAAFNWTDFSATQEAAVSSGVGAVDAFPLGYSPPQAPFSGTPTTVPFAPLLGTTPNRLPVMVSSTLEGSLYGLRAGPYLDVPLGKRMVITLSGGLALTIVDGEYRHSESVSTPGGTTVTVSSRASEASPVLGGFVGLQVSVKVAEHINVFAGSQYQGSNRYKLSVADTEAQIDFRRAIYFSTGVNFSF